MPMYNLFKFSENCSKKSRNLWEFYRPEVNNDDKINSELFKFKLKITGTTSAASNSDVVIAVPLRKLRNFWRPLEIP